MMRVLKHGQSFRKAARKTRPLFLTIYVIFGLALPASAHSLFEILSEKSSPVALTLSILLFGAIVFGVFHRISNLKMHQRIFFDVAEGLGQAFWLMSGRRVVYVSPSFESVCRCSIYDFLKRKKGAFSAIHPEDRQRLAESLQKHFSSQRSDVKVEFRVQYPNRHDRWVELRAFNRAGKAGTVWNSIGVVRDITEHKRELIVSREQEARYRQLIQNANSAIIRMDAKGRITFFNEFAQKFFDYTEKEILGRSVIGTIVAPTIMSEDELILIISHRKS